MRTPIIAGNWKMNNTIREALTLIDGIKKHNLNHNVDVVVCVPFTCINEVAKSIKDTNIKLGAQNMHWEDKGAFTGEVSPKMLIELGVEYVIIGHSERRTFFNETDDAVNKKIKAALINDLKPIVCIGETLDERESNRQEEIVKSQLLKALDGVNKEDIKKIIIAYEPIWAIGTGKTASSEDANSMCEFIRNIIAKIYDEEEKQTIRIQYGGSVKPDNIKEIMSMPDIDGALVGGASLKAEDFVKLINY